MPQKDTNTLLKTTNGMPLAAYLNSLSFAEKQSAKVEIEQLIILNRTKLNFRLTGVVKFTELEKNTIATIYQEDTKILFP
jgi:hypothetical protein